MRARLLVGLLTASALGQAQVYQRLDPVTGQITYTNRPPAGLPVEAGSQAVEPPIPLSQVPPVPRQTKRPHRTTAATSAASTPATFPRVSGEEQKRRDQDRQGILSEELRAEIAELQRLGERPSNDETARRHRENIASLKRELSNLR